MTYEPKRSEIEHLMAEQIEEYLPGREQDKLALDLVEMQLDALKAVGLRVLPVDAPLGMLTERATVADRMVWRRMADNFDPFKWEKPKND